MNSEDFQHLSQIAVLIGLIIVAVGGYFAWSFGKQFEKDKEIQAKQQQKEREAI